MRAAPAVSALLDDCRPERLLIALLYGATGAALAAWGAAHAGAGDGLFGQLGPLVPLLGLLIGAVAGLKLARHLLPAGLSQLIWDGQAWSLQRQASAGQPDTVVLTELRRLFDLGPWQLLRACEGPGRQRWLVLRERRVGAGWHLLRVALAAHARGRV